ncbi:MAG: S-layer homology domain-containing protein, partial [Chloroflexia bacterium]
MGTITPRPTPPVVLRPHVQFGYAHPDETRIYHQGVVNRMSQPVTVDLTVESLNGWPVSVDPTQVVALPGVPMPLTVSVQVPESPEYRIDVERTTASIDSPNYATHAYIVTIVRRHEMADLTEDYWADGPVQYLLDRGVVTGYSDGTYRPNENVTRAQFAKMIVGAMDWSLVTPESSSFSDVAPDNWAYSFIETAAAHGIISG